jgi:hypothetical protein
MAVTKDLTKATPYEDANSKVAKWGLEYTYENDSEGDATYYKSVFRETVEQAYTDANGDAQTNFTLQGKGDFSKADLVALCSIAKWDSVFASQVDSVITNPVVNPIADESFSVPS